MRTGKYPQKFDRARLLVLWNELQNQHEIARLLGVCQTSVGRALNKLGIHPGRGFRLPIHQLPMVDVARRYLAGESTLDLGTAYGVNPEVIRRRLARMGVQRRGLKESRARGSKNHFYRHGEDRRPMHYHRRQSYEVAAICLGQPLPQGWVIHHLDEDATNNHPENLVLFHSQRDHVRFHMQLVGLQRKGLGADANPLVLAAGGQALPQPPVPIVF